MKLLKFENEIAVNKTNKIVTMVRIYQSRPNLEDWSIFFPLSSLKTKPYLWPTGLSSLCSPKLFSESKRWREPKRCCWSSLGSIHWTFSDRLCCLSVITGFHPKDDNLLTLGEVPLTQGGVDHPLRRLYLAMRDCLEEARLFGIESELYFRRLTD